VWQTLAISDCKKSKPITKKKKKNKKNEKKQTTKENRPRKKKRNITYKTGDAVERAGGAHSPAKKVNKLSPGNSNPLLRRPPPI
jgi:hypothetical protein